MHRSITLGRTFFAVVVLIVTTAAEAGFPSTETFLPAIGRVAGQNGAQFYTTVWATNLTSAPVSFRFEFLKEGQSNTSPTSFSDTLSPGETKMYEDVVESKLGLADGLGAARVTSSGEILLAERIYNLEPGDDLGKSEGLFFAGVPKTFSISLGQSASIQGVNQGGSEDFRYNFALVETGGGSPTVNVQLFDGDGTLLGQKAYPLEPYEQIQPNVKDLDAGIATTNARITATVTGGTGSVIVAGAQLANESQDSSGFEMSFSHGVGCTEVTPYAADVWAATATTNAPGAREYHTAVWTGSKMIVWGGDAGKIFLNTGGIYDPVSNSWSAISTTNAPSGRDLHTAVWTGSKMIVWGGFDGSKNLDTGGVYDPVANSWSPISTTNAPSARDAHSAVWTGSKMIVWSGAGGGVRTSTGGVYDPITNTWSAISTATAPSGRDLHTAVWTGSKMIVWGGYATGGLPTNTGGVYDPAADSWSATLTSGAPSPRAGHSAVWTGSRMIIWGGTTSGSLANTGGIYDPAKNSWRAMSTTNAPSARYLHAAVWTGSKMIVWAGALHQGFTDTGGVWTPLAFCVEN